MLYLDLDHTDGNRYMTWNKDTFPAPDEILTEFRKHGRKLVTIVDCHIKVDEKYKIYQKSVENDVCVKDFENKEYQNVCWPGKSIWMDYFNPKALEVWADLYKEYIQPDLHTWNDMNEYHILNKTNNLRGAKSNHA